MLTPSDTVTRQVIERLLKGEDYRIAIVTLINAEFLQYAVDFFKRIVDAKLRNEMVTTDWYRAEFLKPALPSDELIMHSGLNRRTISNMYNSAGREIALEATARHHERLYEVINSLVEQGDDGVDITLTIKFRGVSVDLNVNESLVVINVLAVKRAELRGGAWSTAGKQVEKILMQVLCRLYSVPSQNYVLTGLTGSKREVDFYLIDRSGNQYHCEAKLMGKGNPESADTIYARDTDVFVADKLSDLNKKQLTKENVHWVELRSPGGYRKFKDILQVLDVPYTDFESDLAQRLQEVWQET